MLMAVLLVTTIFGFASTFRVVHAAPFAVFTQSNCNYCPTDSVTTSAYTQSWKLGVKNNCCPNNSNPHTIYVQFSVAGVGSTGDTFTVVSDVIVVAANSVSNGNALTLPLTGAEIGETFTVAYTLEWGTTLALGNTLSAPSDVFTVSYP